MKPGQFAALLSLSLLPQLAHAHSPIEGIGDFYNGMLHPLLVPSHVLLLLALGLLLGQQGLRSMRYGLPLFVLTLCVGLLANGSLSNEQLQPYLLLCALACSLLVVLARQLPLALACCLALTLGLLLGLDSPSELDTPQARLLMLIGTGLSASLLMLFISGTTEVMQQQWQQIGKRILGSWISASILLVLTLGMAATATTS
jgi:urease accessory protein